MIEIIQTTSNHLKELSLTMRESDVCEVMKFGLSAKDALYRSFEESIETKSVMVDGAVGAIYGLCGVMMDLTGKPWLLTSPIVEKHFLYLASLYRREAYKMLKLFPILENWVDADYTKSVRLLELVGFTVYDPEPYGPKGATFRRFRLSSENAA